MRALRVDLPARRGRRLPGRSRRERRSAAGAGGVRARTAAPALPALQHWQQLQLPSWLVARMRTVQHYCFSRLATCQECHLCVVSVRHWQPEVAELFSARIAPAALIDPDHAAGSGCQQLWCRSWTLLALRCPPHVALWLRVVYLYYIIK